MPTTEEELATTLQHTLATAGQGKLQWVKTLQGAGIPTNAHGLLLRFTNGCEFQLLILRTKHPPTDPVNRTGSRFQLLIPEGFHDDADV